MTIDRKFTADYSCPNITPAQQYPAPFRRIFLFKRWFYSTFLFLALLPLFHLLILVYYKKHRDHPVCTCASDIQISARPKRSVTAVPIGWYVWLFTIATNQMTSMTMKSFKVKGGTLLWSGLLLQPFINFRLLLHIGLVDLIHKYVNTTLSSGF